MGNGYFAFFVWALFVPSASAALFRNLDELSTNESTIARFLLMILIFLLTFSALSRFGRISDKRGINIVISLAISILGVRFLSEEQLIYGILLPYGIVGALITFILPFVIFFFIIHMAGMNSIARKISWIVFSFVFLIIFINNYSAFSYLSKYVGISFFVLSVFAFLFDREIQRYMFMKFKIKNKI